MAVHLPLSVEAQAECRFPMLSPNNLLKPSDGGPVCGSVPGYGSRHLLPGRERPGSIGEGKYFRDINEAILAYENKYIKLQTHYDPPREDDAGRQCCIRKCQQHAGTFLI